MLPQCRPCVVRNAYADAITAHSEEGREGWAMRRAFGDGCPACREVDHGARLEQAAAPMPADVDHDARTAELDHRETIRMAIVNAVELLPTMDHGQRLAERRAREAQP